MPGGGFSVSAPSGQEFEAKITPVVIISCIMAATGGLMFGYDVGVSGMKYNTLYVNLVFSIMTRLNNMLISLFLHIYLHAS